jgi:solute carrier family 35 protein F1/2
MVDKTLGTKTTAVETYERPLGNSYRKSADGLADNGQGIEGLEMSGEGVLSNTNEPEVVEEAVLEQGLHALEGKNKAWYTYLTTRDFWIVLLIGYVPIPIAIYFTYSDNQTDKFSPSASQGPTLSPPFS